MFGSMYRRRRGRLERLERQQLQDQQVDLAKIQQLRQRIEQKRGPLQLAKPPVIVGKPNATTAASTSCGRGSHCSKGTTCTYVRTRIT